MIVPLAARGPAPDEVLAVPGRPCSLRAAMLMAHAEWASTNLTRESFQRAWVQLPSFLSSRSPSELDPKEWISFESLIRFDEAVVEAYGESAREAVLCALGRTSAERNFSGRLELRKGFNVHSHFFEEETHHSRFQDFGRGEYVPTGSNSLMVEHHDYPVRSRTYCLSACGYFEASVAFMRGDTPIVVETLCRCLGDDRCAFRLSWED